MACSILEITYSKFISDADGNLIRAVLLCDTAAELPGINDFSGYTLIQGSTCHVIADNQDYMLDSGGSWHPYGGEMWQNVYTKSEADTLLNGKQGLLDAAQLAAVNSGITAAKLSVDEAALAEVVDAGAKNIADGRRNDTTSGGVDFAFAENGTFTANGRASDHKATASIMLQICEFTPESGVEYVVSGCPANGSNNTYALRVTTLSDTTIVWETGSGASFVAPSNDNLSIKCSIKSGTVVDNLHFAPMICTAADWAISQTYQPYRPSWQEMYQMILALQ